MGCRCRASSSASRRPGPASSTAAGAVGVAGVGAHEVETAARRAAVADLGAKRRRRARRAADTSRAGARRRSRTSPLPVERDALDLHLDGVEREGGELVAPRRQRQRRDAREPLAGEVEVQLEPDVDDAQRTIGREVGAGSGGRRVAWCGALRRGARATRPFTLRGAAGDRQTETARPGARRASWSNDAMDSREPVRHRHHVAARHAARGLRRRGRLPRLPAPLPRAQGGARARLDDGERRARRVSRPHGAADPLRPRSDLLGGRPRRRPAHGGLDLRRGGGRDELRGRLALRARGRRDARRLPGERSTCARRCRASCSARSPTASSRRRCRTCSRRSSARSGDARPPPPAPPYQV